MLLMGHMKAGSPSTAPTDDDTIWKALSDATRRAILDQLRGAPVKTGELCEQFPSLTRFAVMKHLGVLERAGLVIVRREGRCRWNALNPAPLQQIYDRWMSPHLAPFAHVGARLKEKLESESTRED